MQIRDVRAALRSNQQQVLRDFRGLPLTEQTEQVLVAAALHSHNRGEWLNDDNIMLSFLSCSTPAASDLENARIDLQALKSKIDGYPPTGSADIQSPNFWALSETGPAAAEFATRNGRGHIDTVSLAAGILASSLARPPLGRDPVLEICSDLDISMDALIERFALHASLDPNIEDLQFTLTLVSDTIRFHQTGLLDGFRYRAEPDEDSGLIIVRANVLQERGLLDASIVAALDELINDENVSEQDLQEFFEVHPSFLLGYEYKALHSQLTLFRDDSPNLRPDFFLERADSDFCDILDLKKPNVRLAKHPRNRSGFVAAVYDAIHQLREYRDFFEDIANREAFHCIYGLRAYRPRVTVVIGRNADLPDYEQRVRMQDSLAGHFHIVTYDDILAYATRRQLFLQDFWR